MRAKLPLPGPLSLPWPPPAAALCVTGLVRAGCAAYHRHAATHNATTFDQQAYEIVVRRVTDPTHRHVRHGAGACVSPHRRARAAAVLNHHLDQTEVGQLWGQVKQL